MCLVPEGFPLGAGEGQSGPSRPVRRRAWPKRQPLIGLVEAVVSYVGCYVYEPSPYGLAASSLVQPSGAGRTPHSLSARGTVWRYSGRK